MQCKNRPIEDLWTLFDLIKAEEVCGISRDNETRKQTAWWSKNLKEAVKCKKQRWKEYFTGQHGTIL